MKTRTRAGRLLGLALLLVALMPSTEACFPRRGFITIGTAIDVLPDGFLTVTVEGGRYYYHRGVFYRPYRSGWVVVRAPLGAVIDVPPPGYVMVLVENDPFAYYRGVFYEPYGARYVVVRAPVGAFVRALPRTAVPRRIDGVEYKEYAGVWYRPAVRRGERGYEVTDPPPRR